MMAAIAKTTNANTHFDNTYLLGDKTIHADEREAWAVALAAATMADTMAQVKAILVFTRSGQTARLIAACRPKVPIIAVTMSERVAHQLSLVRGVMSCHTPVVVDTLIEMGDLVTEASLRSGLVASGELVVITGSHPLNVAKTTNFIKLIQVGKCPISESGWAPDV
jgi:pyruvate kinase